MWIDFLKRMNALTVRRFSRIPYRAMWLDVMRLETMFALKPG